MMTSKTAIVWALPVLSSSAWAAETDTAATAGLGGAGVAIHTGTDAIGRCPAAMVLAEEYSLELGFQLDGPWAEGWRGRAALRDTRTSLFGAGVSYTRDRWNPEVTMDDLPGWATPSEDFSNNSVEESIRFGAGYALGHRAAGLGIGLVWDRLRTELEDPAQSFELDASVAGRVLPVVSLAATARDLLPGSRDPSVDAGTWIRATDWFDVSVDAVWAGETVFGGRLGTQFTLGEVARIRAGGEWIGEERGAAAGIGFFGLQSMLDYGIRYDLVSSGISHTIGLSLLF